MLFLRWNIPAMATDGGGVLQQHVCCLLTHRQSFSWHRPRASTVKSTAGPTLMETLCHKPQCENRHLFLDNNSLSATSSPAEGRQRRQVWGRNHRELRGNLRRADWEITHVGRKCEKPSLYLFPSAALTVKAVHCSHEHLVQSDTRKKFSTFLSSL